jgi:hypothetical protein
MGNYDSKYFKQMDDMRSLAERVNWIYDTYEKMGIDRCLYQAGNIS